MASCPLASRLLKTARLATPPDQAHLLPEGDCVNEGELLLAMIHRCVCESTHCSHSRTLTMENACWSYNIYYHLK